MLPTIRQPRRRPALDPAHRRPRLCRRTGLITDHRSVVGLIAAVLQFGHNLTFDDHRPMSQPGSCGTQAIGNLMQRNTDDNDHAEEQQQDQQWHRHIDGQEVREQAGGDIADDAAGIAESFRLVGPRQPARNVDQAQ